MNERQFGDKIAHHLDRGLDLGPRAKARLQTAREQALARQRAEPATGIEWADTLAADAGGWGALALRLLAPLVALGIGLSAIYTWQQNQRLAEVEEIDAQLLTDDLPIDALLDRGFQNWLKKRAAEQ